jgi:hypothetical protein
MKRIKANLSLTEKVRGLQIGEVAKVCNRDCKESVLRNIAYRLKKEGLLYSVSAIEDYCLITRVS